MVKKTKSRKIKRTQKKINRKQRGGDERKTLQEMIDLDKVKYYSKPDLNNIINFHNDDPNLFVLQQAKKLENKDTNFLNNDTNPLNYGIFYDEIYGGNHHGYYIIDEYFKYHETKRNAFDPGETNLLPKIGVYLIDPENVNQYIYKIGKPIFYDLNYTNMQPLYNLYCTIILNTLNIDQDAGYSPIPIDEMTMEKMKAVEKEAANYHRIIAEQKLIRNNVISKNAAGQQHKSPKKGRLSRLKNFFGIGPKKRYNLRTMRVN